jgi:hypothetical protein
VPSTTQLKKKDSTYTPNFVSFEVMIKTGMEIPEYITEYSGTYKLKADSMNFSSVKPTSEKAREIWGEIKDSQLVLTEDILQ